MGLVHGYTMLRDEREADWDELCEAITREYGDAYYLAMWVRPQASRPSLEDPELPAGMRGVDYVLHVHDLAPEPRRTARRILCLDTGVHYPGGHLTVAELRPGTPALHRHPRVDVLPVRSG